MWFETQRVRCKLQLAQDIYGTGRNPDGGVPPPKIRVKLHAPSRQPGVVVHAWCKVSREQLLPAASCSPAPRCARAIVRTNLIITKRRP